jgi:Xaa-Pro dipeptidase
MLLPAAARMTDWKTLYKRHLEVIALRHAHAAERAAAPALLIDAGAPVRYFGDDQAAPFRASAWFRQWLPLDDAAHCCLYVRAGARPVLFYHQPRDYWHAPPADPAGDWVDAFDIRIVDDEAALARALAGVVEQGAVYLGGARERVAELPIAAVNPAAACDYLDYHRATKTPYEQACIEAATATAVRGHVAAAAAWTAGGSEYDVLLAYLAASAQTEADTPYASIVAENAHAAVLHYQHRDRVPAGARRSLLVDAGATHRGYAADITRTWTGADSHGFGDLVAALDAAQQALVAGIRPGMPFADLHAAAHLAVGRILVHAGLLRTSPEHAAESGITRTFLPHGLGHLLGLNTHDAGGHLADDHGRPRPPPARDPFLRNTRTIDIDQVFTIEPGIYFIPMLLEALRGCPLARHVRFDAVDALCPCGGVRIEDNVVVTATGARNLTREAFAARAGA